MNKNNWKTLVKWNYFAYLKLQFRETLFKNLHGSEYRYNYYLSRLSEGNQNFKINLFPLLERNWSCVRIFNIAHAEEVNKLFYLNKQIRGYKFDMYVDG